MSIFGDILGSGLSAIGAINESKQRQNYTRLAKRKLFEKPQPLEIPAAYKDLLASLNDQSLQLGKSQSDQISQGFQQQLAHVLGQLNMRGLSSSNLTANLTAGNEKKKQDAISSLQENLLAQRLGMQQNIGQAGLSQRSAQNAQLAGIQGGMFGDLGKTYFQPGGGNGFLTALTGLANFASQPGSGNGGGQAPLFNSGAPNIQMG